jgi:hypothetical protein
LANQARHPLLLAPSAGVDLGLIGRKTIADARSNQIAILKRSEESLF